MSQPVNREPPAPPRIESGVLLPPADTQPAGRGLPHHTTVGEVMKQPVVAVDPRVGFATAIAAAGEHHHDVLPVVDDQKHVMGMVCASDLLAKLAVQALPVRPAFFEPRDVRALRRRALAVEAGELMTRPAVTVTTTTTVARAALIAIRHRVHHLPVVDDKRRLTGMVCLCDLLDVERRSDAEILAEVREVALAPNAGLTAATLQAGCEQGRVVLDGRTARRSQAERLRRRVRAIEGVVDVRDQLRWDLDDVGPGPADLGIGIGK